MTDQKIPDEWWLFTLNMLIKAAEVRRDGYDSAAKGYGPYPEARHYAAMLVNIEETHIDHWRRAIKRIEDRNHD